MADLFAGTRRHLHLAGGAVVLGGFAEDAAQPLLEVVERVAAVSPFRRMLTPGGRLMAVAMTNCGAAGWITDRRGYRYAPLDPETGAPWPGMSEVLLDLGARAAAAAGFDAFVADACLINRYQPGVGLSLHQDRNEREFRSPVVSVSLGLPAIFLWGGLRRSDRPQRVMLHHGDVVVWGGPVRLAFHGVLPLAEGEHPATGGLRYNLTLRRAL